MFNILKNDETKIIGKRTVVNLNGNWAVGESMEAEAIAEVFDHRADVPGVLSTADPPFVDCGKFSTRFYEYAKDNWKMCTGGVINMPVDEEVKASEIGISRQPRNYFWYKRTFMAPVEHTYADLIVLKARFGSKVWLNGTVVGSNDSCFTSARYDVASLINWGEENEIIIRVGAHQGVLPKGTLNLEDCEHLMWYPGIWDDVELYCYNNPKVASIQIAPKIQPKEILVETVLENRADETVAVSLSQKVKTADMEGTVGGCVNVYNLAPKEIRTVTCTISLPDTELWTPDTPNLYILETSTDGDTELTRFGMREVGFKTSTKRFYLNGNVCFLRGGLMTFDRFVEDPLSQKLPWTEEWVRKLLGESRRSMSWNMTKYCISDVPRKWLDIADEEGLMGVPELPIWCFNPERADSFNGYTKTYDMDCLVETTKQWVRDQRNHASVIYWSSALETCATWTGDTIIPTGRAEDLEKRAWLNCYSPAVDADDPVENHPYQFTTNGLPDEWGVPGFDMKMLEGKCGLDRQSVIGNPSQPTGHAQVISEYGWLWLTRGGEPGLYLANTYHKLPYPVATPQERLETNSYLLGGLTEYWRAHRNYTQVMYNAWLAGDMGPGHCAVCDNYKDPTTLEFQPAFLKYVKEAFKPLGVYLEFWKREVQAGENRVFYVMLVNDYLERKEGEVILEMKYEDETIEIARQKFVMSDNGSATLCFNITIPGKLGKTDFTATAITTDGLKTISTRWVEVKEEIPPRPYGEF